MDPAPRVVRVTAAARTYEARVGAGLLAAAGARLGAHATPGPTLVVTDANVGPLYLPAVRQTLAAAGFAPRPLVLPAGENLKSPAGLSLVYAALAGMEADRGTPVVALGGGVVGDLAGYAAATYLRGVPWLALPTSLLAQVDASVGGKTGIDLPEGKNLVGAFHPPVEVLADVATLRTLPVREHRAGLAEVVKTALALRPDLLADLVAAPARFADAADLAAAERAVSACVAAKAEVVSADEREGGRRRILNLGHTAGHAIEAAAGFGPVLHGEAVSVGLAVALAVSVRRGLLPAAEAGRVIDLLRALGLPARLADLPAVVAPAALRPFLRRDKKRRGGRLVLVLLRAPGDPVIADDATEEEVLAALA